MTITTLQRTAAIAAAAGIVLAASACSSGSPTESGAPEDAGTGVLNVGQISDSVAFFPLFVAEENGYFEEEGVELGDRPRLGTGARLAAALTSGSIDIAAGVTTDAMNLYESDDRARLTGSLVTEYYVDIIVSSDFDGPAADAPVEERIAALQGRNIGITGPGSGTEALVTHLFGTEGLDPSTDATLVNLGAEVSAAIGALSSGQVDALAFFQPVGQIAEMQGVGEIYISPQRGDVPSMDGQLHGALFSTTDVLDEKGELVASFNRAIDSALAFIADDPEGASELLASYLGGSDPAVVEALSEILPEEMASSTVIEQAGYETAATFHLDSGLVAEAPAYADFVWEGAAE
ncbi:ABC transporter substrate-binding protein [Agrococcus lahaulensis]|nr:ABC transporter substrate-binding protein [Agrococcus lahaulensis]